jgi:diketogulonate reductase-like aldo/keto reductase
VSNFDAAELRELGEWARVQPAVVQRNSDLFSQDKEARHLCESKGWQYEAYSSLGSQWLMRGHRQNPVLSHAEVKKIARMKGKSPAQVVLRWAIQHGQVVIPRSSKRGRIVENLDVAGWTLDGDEMSALDALDGHPPFVTSNK